MATYVSLKEADADFDVKIIRLKNNEQSTAEFAALNPKKKVPYLIIDGKGLTENIAMQTWIAENFPAAKLMPIDSWDQKQALSYMSWFGSGLHPHMTRHYKPIKFCAEADAHADIQVKAKAMYMEQLELIESELAGKTQFFDHYTVCDSYFFWIYERAIAEGFDLSGLKQCTAHNTRMRERDSVQQVLAHL